MKMNSEDVNTNERESFPSRRLNKIFPNTPTTNTNPKVDIKYKSK